MSVACGESIAPVAIVPPFRPASVCEPVLQFAGDQRLDRVDHEAPAARELAQAVDDLGPDRAERVLERGHVRRHVVELDRTAD